MHVKLHFNQKCPLKLKKYFEVCQKIEGISVASRVTRLGEKSPNGRLFTLDSYLKITEVSHTFGLLYSMVKFKHNFGQKNGLGYILGDFSQTRLATLGSML
jgi:hypothetical protein